MAISGNYSIVMLFCLSLPAWDQANEKNELANANAVSLSLSTTLSIPDVDTQNRDASFPGGSEALETYLAEHFDCSQDAVENGLEGRVIVKFLIGIDGNATALEIKQPLHPIIDDAARNTILHMPAWLPRLKNGRAVPATVEIPFDVSIQ